MFLIEIYNVQPAAVIVRFFYDLSIRGPATLAGVWLRAIEMEISAALWALVAQEGPLILVDLLILCFPVIVYCDCKLEEFHSKSTLSCNIYSCFSIWLL